MRLQIKIVAGLVSASVLSGCASTIEAVSDSQDSRILNADSVQGERGDQNWTRSVEHVLGIHPCHPETAAAAEFRGSQSSPEDKACVQSQLSNAAPSGVTFFGLQSSASADPGGSAKAKEYLSAGLALSDEVCRIWFGDLARANTTLRQASDTTSAAGTLTTTLLGVTRASPPGIAAVATFFGLGKASIDNLSLNYVVSADLPTVKRTLDTYRSNYSKEIDQYQGDWNYFTARRVIMAYDNTCSALSIQQFIKTKIEGGSVAAATASIQANLTTALAIKFKALINGNPDLTEDELIDIYAYYFSGALRPDVQSQLKAKLSAELGSTAFDGTDVKFAATAGGVAVSVDSGKDNLQKLIRAQNLTAYLSDAASSEIAKFTAQAAQAPDDTIVHTFLNYTAPVVASVAGAPVVPPSQLGWDDIFTVHGSEDTIIRFYIRYGSQYAKITSATVRQQIDDPLKPFRDEATGKLKTLPGRSESDFFTQVKNAKAYPGLESFIVQSAADLVDQLNAQAEKPAAPTQSAVTHQTTAWAMPLAPDGRPLNVPPPITAN